ncbi:hypothetical protein HMPREF8577_0195 [Streptococcus parasanguinis ATCC 903]|uniref:Lipoprotein n=1 Tax=Streptococcus parasanguinis TaxID=1318 RepID=A0AAX4AWI6_STRPA|nr:hypothetical protein [Streptococcus parasanguinis]EFX39486.1 hypothetical protein HMPREF8577_0195 [Streptococcus parasanguinis ATCC 903]WNB83030.1 hypothetical protein RDV49_08920 [Streptococcus parasanguinis]
MKKMILSTAALLTIVSLAACSNKQETKKETSNSQSTTKVTSKSANTTKSKDTSTDSEKGSTSSVVTDEDISKAKTVGDFKKLYAKLMDQTVSLTEEAGSSVTGSAKEQYDATISALKQELENQKDIFNEGLESIGSDSTVVPKEDREALIEILKDARDELESRRKELKDMQKELSKSPVADDDSDDSDSDSEE